MAGPRRRAREVALQILHQMDAGGLDDAREALDRYFAHLSLEGGPVADDDGDAAESGAGGRIDRGLVEELVRGVGAHRAEIDDMLTELSRNWRLERMAVVERNVIRIALYELRHAESVPISVVLNEAVELAKRYGTTEGSAFVNGLLDRAVTELKLNR
jgi:transcription antitermination protein NusB